MSRLTATAAIVLCAGFAALGAAGAAAASWSKPASLGKSQYLSQPSASINASGTAVAAWPGDRGVTAAIGNRRGRFQAPRVLARNGYRTVAAVAPDGHAAVAWNDNNQVKASIRAPGGGFSKPIVVSQPKLASPKALDDDPRIAFGRDSQLFVVWARQCIPNCTPGRATAHQIISVTVSKSGAVGPEQQVGKNFASTYPLNMTTDSNGDAAVALISQEVLDDYSTSRLSVARFRNGTIESATVPGSERPYAGSVSPGLGGALAFGWTRSVPTGEERSPSEAAFAEQKPDGTFTPVRIPGRGSGSTFNPKPFATEGGAYDVWQFDANRSGSGEFDEGILIGAPSATLSQRVLAPNNAQELLAAGSSSGGGYLIWQGKRSKFGGARVTRSGAVQSIGGPAGKGDFGHDGGGNRSLGAAGNYAVLLWQAGGKAAIYASVARF